MHGLPWGLRHGRPATLHSVLFGWGQETWRLGASCENGTGKVSECRWLCSWRQKPQVPPQPRLLLKKKAAKEAAKQAGINGQATEKVAKPASRTWLRLFGSMRQLRHHHGLPSFTLPEGLQLCLTGSDIISNMIDLLICPWHHSSNINVLPQLTGHVLTFVNPTVPPVIEHHT